jgi:hypothetical protein
MRVRAALCDESGAPWWRLELSDLLWTLHLRLRGGSLVPLEGPAQRRLPPHVRLTLDLSSKVGIFTVGVRRMVADVTLTRTSGEKGCVARFRCTPDWRLPFLIEPFLRGSLSYPFEGVGSFAGFAIRGSTGQPTRIIREYGLRVRESRIVRWMGGLGSSVLGDFRKGAESESDRYSRECLYALRDDLVSVLNEPAAR